MSEPVKVPERDALRSLESVEDSVSVSVVESDIVSVGVEVFRESVSQ